MEFFQSRFFQMWLLVGLAFIIGEEIFRVRAVGRFGQTRNEMMIDDPVEGRSLQPNVVSRGTLRTIHINEHGVRGKSFAADRPGEVLRIACLGSSTVFGGITNDDEETFPAYLEKILNQRLGEERVEVLNAGIPGMSTSNVQQHLERRISRFQPQIAVIYAIPNDIGVVARSQNPAAPPQHVFKRWRQNHSVMYNALRDKVKTCSPGVVASGFNRFPAGGKDQFETMYDELFRSCQNLGITPVAVSHSVAFRKEQTLSTQHRMLFGDFWGLGLQGAYEAVAMMNGTMREVAARSGVLFVNGEDCIPGTVEFFEDAIHLRPPGNERLAEKVAGELLDHGILDILSSGKNE